MNTRKPIFLDRDGVLNVDIAPYVSRADDLLLFPWTVQALVALDRAGFDLFVVSNQQGVAFGITPPEALAEIDAKIQLALRPHGFQIKRFFYCTSPDAAGDPCRKPSPGMIFEARDAYGLDLAGAFFVGDKDTDIECAWRAGCRGLLVLSGVTQGDEWRGWTHPPERAFPTLLEAVEYAVNTP